MAYSCEYNEYAVAGSRKWGGPQGGGLGLGPKTLYRGRKNYFVKKCHKNIKLLRCIINEYEKYVR
jgi:hypothetical protein